MKNAMQLKAKISALSVKTGVPSQILLQNYMMERWLERLSASRYKDRFVLKGGFLVTSILGIAGRTTMDMDMTALSMSTEQESLRRVMEEVCGIDLEDDVRFVFRDMERIRESATYEGWRVSISAAMFTLALVLRIDITAGDRLTPSAVHYEVPTLLHGPKIPVLAYNLETLLAEKLDAVLSHAEANTRMRDFYDMDRIFRLRKNDIRNDILCQAVWATVSQRENSSKLSDAEALMERIVSSRAMRERWENFRKSNRYVGNLAFDTVCESVLSLFLSVNMRKTERTNEKL